MEPIRKVWAPNPGSQRLFLSCPIREALNEGTRGSGKTDVLAMDFAQHVGAGFGAAWRGILFRRTYKQLDDVVAKTKRWFHQIFPRARLSDYTWKWPSGEELLLRHFDTEDDYWNYHGHEYPWVGWEELTSWPTLDGYDSMLACNRSSYPGIPLKVRSTTNPYGPGHNAVKRYFIDPAPRGQVIVETREIPMLEDGQIHRREVQTKRVAIHSSYIENPQLLQADPMYLAHLESISDPNKRKAWLFGDWDITSGGMFDDLWDKRIHVLRPFEIPGGWRVDRAMDWGESKPFSIGFWAESDGSPATIEGKQRTFPRGTLVRIGEWYGCTGKPNEGLRMNSTQVAVQLKKRMAAAGIDSRCRAGPADSSIFDTHDDSNTAANFEAEGIRWVPADKRKGSRKNGADLFRVRLEAALKDDERPGIYVFNTCTDWLRTVPSLPRSEKDPDDVDTDVEDHAWDETRYRILGPRPIKSSVQPLNL